MNFLRNLGGRPQPPSSAHENGVLEFCRTRARLYKNKCDFFFFCKYIHIKDKYKYYRFSNCSSANKNYGYVSSKPQCFLKKKKREKEREYYYKIDNSITSIQYMNC